MIAARNSRAEQNMQKLLLSVDKISAWVGRAFSWMIVLLTAHISWEVFSRYEAQP